MAVQFILVLGRQEPMRMSRQATQKHSGVQMYGTFILWDGRK